jgi:hypothetical protein
MVEIKKRWPASSLLVQHETKRLDDGCLAGIVLSKQNIHARPEMNCLVGKATEIADANLCQEHIVPKGTTWAQLGPHNLKCENDDICNEM